MFKKIGTNKTLTLLFASTMISVSAFAQSPQLIKEVQELQRSPYLTDEERKITYAEINRSQSEETFLYERQELLKTITPRKEAAEAAAKAEAAAQEAKKREDEAAKIAQNNVPVTQEIQAEVPVQDVESIVNQVNEAADASNLPKEPEVDSSTTISTPDSNPSGSQEAQASTNSDTTSSSASNTQNNSENSEQNQSSSQESAGSAGHKNASAGPNAKSATSGIGELLTKFNSRELTPEEKVKALYDYKPQVFVDAKNKVDSDSNILKLKKEYELGKDNNFEKIYHKAVSDEVVKSFGLESEFTRLVDVAVLTWKPSEAGDAPRVERAAPKELVMHTSFKHEEIKRRRAETARIMHEKPHANPFMHVLVKNITKLWNDKLSDHQAKFMQAISQKALLDSVNVEAGKTKNAMSDGVKTLIDQMLNANADLND